LAGFKKQNYLQGAAILAAVAVGACADAETARQLESGWTYEPNMQEKTIYDEVYTQYKTLTE